MPGLSEDERNKIKVWAYNYPSNFRISDKKKNEERYIIDSDYRDDQENTVIKMGIKGSTHDMKIKNIFKS